MSAPSLAPLRSASRFACRLLDSQPALEKETLAALGQPFTREEMEDFLSAQLLSGENGQDDSPLKRTLRLLRHRVWLRTAARDIAGLAPLEEVTGAFSDLAELCLRTAQDFYTHELAAKHGQPLNADGSPMQLVVVGMGKLGGRELNVSSDIDLIYLYPDEGETAGPSPVSHHEFFVRLGRKLSAAISENTADGYVFRVDLRLRPWGDSGPLAMSYAMLEDYLSLHGRPWERYAWIKGRALTGTRNGELDAIVRPFVFRKYLDFGAYQSIRELHAQIRAEVARKDRQDNIKLGPGGIREIEFAAQVFQLIRGGHVPALRMRPTQEVLKTLAAERLLPEDTVGILLAAYRFLRKLEHRLQYLDDAQTQTLPSDPQSQALIAQAMGFGDWNTLLAELDRHRSKVEQHFDQVFAAPQTDQSTHPLQALWLDPADQAERLAELGYRHAGDSAQRLAHLRELSRHKFTESARIRVDSLMSPILELAAQQAHPDEALGRLADLIEAVARRQTYLALLAEYPAALNQLARLFSASPWAAQLVTRQPQLLDELIDPRQLFAAPDWGVLAQRLTQALDEEAGDMEAQMDRLRRFKQVQTLRLLAQDVAGRLKLETLSDHLAALADLLLAETLRRAWSTLPRRHLETPRFAIVGYGKLGGKELGYASDLDLVFLYDDDTPDAGTIYARLAQKLSTWLTTTTGAGLLYDTDLRLRPDGASGLLVSSIESFEDYQRSHAWTWEHQAITRARFVCGDASVGEKFEAIRHTILTLPREAARLKEDVLAMRQKMRDGHPNDTELFDIKHDAGGIVDVEFAVQYLVLLNAKDQPDLLDNVGNIALLKRCGELGLLPADIAEPAADAYRELRRAQHAVKLAGAEHARLEKTALAGEQAAVMRLWQTVFA
ncbi:bifunctional [glutamate--ammonia ligase]-adenylyl-L-tyrosine phosphorylase/[glutamate--ammonia-ligase] adenylyltransferase [Betaproteobacteria bacterium SCN2]|jgi:glutamate-ammonia-ligase adenylyltransferase|nr:bifunctional [glutamate--ammonia ligase]-adenylyl-L-tyrosine phosphorylase/[glutamate--ammonia-ligase] adenylyltransferase [Betaproteobacteria bacterium SCN2]